MQQLIFTLKIPSSRVHVFLFMFNIKTVFLNYPVSSVITAKVR